MLIRGLRNFQQNYEHNFSSIADTVEILRNSMALEFGGDICAIEMMSDYPSAVFLHASIIPIKIDNVTCLVRNESGKIFEIDNIYDAKFFHIDSEVNNHFCKAVYLKYEDNGYYIHDGKKEDLIGKETENFKLCFSDNLLQFDFDICDTFHLSEKSINQEIIYDDGSKVSCKFYPYGGFYFYGCHLKQIEPCVFRSVFDRTDLKIKSYTISSLLNKNIDVRKDTRNYKKVNFSFPPSLNLYDKIRDGGCKIQLIKNEETITYTSCSVYQIIGTNLIVIKFETSKKE